MTPAIDLLRQRGISFQIHEYDHDPRAVSYGLEAAEKLGLPPDRIFKTLVVSLGADRLAVAILPVNATLSMKFFARHAGAKKAAMAAPRDVASATGYVPGGISPLGQRKSLKTLIDASAEPWSSIYVSAGRRGLEIELDPDDLRDLVAGHYAPICQ